MHKAKSIWFLVTFILIALAAVSLFFLLSPKAEEKLSPEEQSLQETIGFIQLQTIQARARDLQTQAAPPPLGEWTSDAPTQVSTGQVPLSTPTFSVSETQTQAVLPTQPLYPIGGTASSTPVPTDTTSPLIIPTNIPVSTFTQTQTPTSTPTPTTTQSATPASTNQATPTRTLTKQATQTGTLLPTKTSTPTATHTHTNVPTATRTSTLTPTLTQTSTTVPPATPTATYTNTVPPTAVPEGWEGTWEVTFEKPDGSLSDGLLEIALEGTDLTGSMSLEELVFVFDGIVFSEGRYATGSWANAVEQGYFWWTLGSAGQFQGCHANLFAFCGSRPGIGRPSPCLQLPPR